MPVQANLVSVELTNNMEGVNGICDMCSYHISLNFGHYPLLSFKMIRNNPIYLVQINQDDMQDFLENRDQSRSLAAKIPVSVLENLDISDESFKKTVAAIKWHKQQVQIARIHF